ncbi:hypothetical protein Zm00014a_010154 [Zea mays]|uniref:Uncharacterized protein n=1 Tax=Zea mays TaxID=4577 RepID=A0A3L6DJC9_MAIZE|nr:hypothetical protein Zm00014a_010154 [Zea mays]
MRVVSLSHRILGLKQPLCICRGRLVLIYPFSRPHSRGSLWH